MFLFITCRVSGPNLQDSGKRPPNKPIKSNPPSNISGYIRKFLADAKLKQQTSDELSGAFSPF